MCGIIGFHGKNTTNNLEAIHNLLYQSKIRGLHSSGVSYLFNGDIKTIKEEIPADQFLRKNWENISKDLSSQKEILLVGHTRYSTSELGYPQPISSANGSIVLNGVITQSEFHEWKDLYKINTDNYATQNDAEIMLDFLENRTIEELYSIHPFSSAICYLDKSKQKIIFFRTNDRPLHGFQLEEGVGFCSTKEILNRAEISSLLDWEVSAGFLFSSKGENLGELIHFDEDIQNYD